MGVAPVHGAGGEEGCLALRVDEGALDELGTVVAAVAFDKGGVVGGSDDAGEEGRWRVSYAGMTSELRICDFGGGLWMMTYWIDGVKEDEGTIDVYDGALHFEGKRGGGMYFLLDTYNHTLYADGNKTIPFRYAGSLM